MLVGERQLRGRERDFASALCEPERRARETRDVEPVASFPRHVDAARRDHPGPRFLQRPVAQEEDTDEIVGQHEDPALPAGLEVEANGIGKAPGEGGADEGLHR